MTRPAWPGPQEALSPQQGPQARRPLLGSRAEEGSWPALGPAWEEGPGKSGRGPGGAPKDSPAGRLGGPWPRSGRQAERGGQGTQASGPAGGRAPGWEGSRPDVARETLASA